MRRLLLAILWLLLAGIGRGVSAAPDLVARATEALRRHAADPDRGVRFAVVQAVGRTRPLDLDLLTVALADPEWCVRREAAWSLRRGGDPAFARLQAVLEKGGAAARGAAAWALSSFGAKAIPALRRAFADEEEDVRLEALAAAGRLGKDVGAPLAEALRAFLAAGRSANEREEARDALAILEAKSAAPAAPEVPTRPEPESAPAEPGAPSEPESPPGAPAPAESDGPREGTSPDPALSPPPELDAIFTRIESVLAMGAGPSDAPALRAALEDPERDVRIAAVVALDRSRGDAVPALLRALKDPNPRVVRTALPALGRRRAGAAEIAPFLADPALATSDAARQALEAIGPSAAIATAEAMATGSYAALHHGRLLFEAFGEGGAAATPILARLLAHADANVREVAARSLFPIGPQAHVAAPVLAEALEDHRLCVVANAALALGAVGLSEEAIAALDDPRARVRAYAAFAVGWSLGLSAGTDLPRFEPRLPVLDVGAPGPFPSADEVAALAAKADPTLSKARRDALLRTALPSKDPRVSVRAAIALDENAVNAVEAERVIELLAPEGVRDGSNVDFDPMRSLLGSSEMLACVQYAMRARRCSPTLSGICSHLHRISRSDDLPGLLWISANEEPGIANQDGELWMPSYRTLRFGRELSVTRFDHAPDADDLARAELEMFRKKPDGGFDSPAIWRLRDFRPKPEDAELLLVCEDLAESVVEHDRGREHASLWALVRLLGFLDDGASLAVLRRLGTETSETGDVARAALARRGDADALRALVAGSRDDEAAFALLLEVAPTVANRALAARLLSPTEKGSIEVVEEVVEELHRLGLRAPPEAFLGIEAAVTSRPRSVHLLETVFRFVPGCATRRIASRVLDGWDASDPAAGAADPLGSLRDDADVMRLVAFLAASDPQRTGTALRGRLALPEDAFRFETITAALRLKQDALLPPLLARLRRLPPSDRGDYDLGVWIDPEIQALLLEWANDPKATQDDRDSVLGALARQLGARNEGTQLQGAFLDETAATAALRRGDRAAFEKLRTEDASAPEPRWMTMARAAAGGDAWAKYVVWSALRAGRYRWMHNGVLERWLTLGHDPSTLPHWAMDLDSNCCRVSDGMGSEVFERGHGVPQIADRHRRGVGRPASEFVRDWMGLFGGRFVWSPVTETYIPEPE